MTKVFVKVTMSFLLCNFKEAHEGSGILHVFVHGIPHVENELNGYPLLVEFQIVAFLSFYTVPCYTTTNSTLSVQTPLVELLPYKLYM